jgi:hypothetical protein
VANPTRSLRDVIRKLAYKTSIDQLKKDGFDKVNVLGLDRIALLIQEAVQRSLRFKLLAVEREEVASATKEEFLRLLKSNEDLERKHDELRRLKEVAEEQVDDLRRELAQQERLLERKLAMAESAAANSYHGEDRAIAERLGVLIEGLLQAGENEELRDRVLDLVMDIVRNERREATKAREAVRDHEVGTLQRRIQKLATSLHETEHRLTEVTAIKNIDQGISSVYKEVQGLNQAASHFDQKKALMEDIFAANRRLQKGPGSNRAAVKSRRK